MKLMLLLITAVALAPALPASAQSRTQVNICGTLTDYRAPTQTQPGLVTVGSERFAISSDARQNVSSSLRVGTDACLVGTWVMSQTVGRNLVELTLGPRATAAPTAPTSAQPTRTLPSTGADPSSSPGGFGPGVAVLGVLAVLLAILAVTKLRHA